VIEEDIPILVCRLSDYSEDEDVLKLYKANYSEEMEATFLITSFPVLRKGLAFFKRLSQE
jgi:inositol 1,4,5-triphosphate receptor type 1/inositol 1,4,5-triphosphate receptor type 3